MKRQTFFRQKILEFNLVAFILSIRGHHLLSDMAWCGVHGALTLRDVHPLPVAVLW